MPFFLGDFIFKFQYIPEEFIYSSVHKYLTDTVTCCGDAVKPDKSVETGGGSSQSTFETIGEKTSHTKRTGDIDSGGQVPGTHTDNTE